MRKKKNTSVTSQIDANLPAQRLLKEIFEVADQQKINQADFARRLDCSDSYVSRLRSAENLTVNQLYKICEAIGIKVEVELKYKPLAPVTRPNQENAELVAT
jgi:transcriptional regulator with XRE-family HTH domain